MVKFVYDAMDVFDGFLRAACKTNWPLDQTRGRLSPWSINVTDSTSHNILSISSQCGGSFARDSKVYGVDATMTTLEAELYCIVFCFIVYYSYSLFRVVLCLWTYQRQWRGSTDARSDEKLGWRRKSGGGGGKGGGGRGEEFSLED